MPSVGPRVRLRPVMNHAWKTPFNVRLTVRNASRSENLPRNEKACARTSVGSASIVDSFGWEPKKNKRRWSAHAAARPSPACTGATQTRSALFACAGHASTGGERRIVHAASVPSVDTRSGRPTGPSFPWPPCTGGRSDTGQVLSLLPLPPRGRVRCARGASAWCSR